MATTNPLIDYKVLTTNGRTSYIDPTTGKTVYLDRVGPEGSSLTPMNLSNPAAITNGAAPTGLDALIQKLLSSMAPSGKPAETPMTYDLPGIYAGMAASGSAAGDKSFEDLIGRIGAPSSVDQAQKALDTAGVEQLMAEIDRNTRGSLASTKLDALDRGFGGSRGYGDIEANALAQVRTGADRTKASAQLGAYQAELARQKAREDAVNAAYGKRYELKSATDIQDRSVIGTLLGQQYSAGMTQREGALDRASREGQNYLNTILSYALKTGELSQEDAQFYAGLISKENIAAADRTAAYDRAILGTRKTDKDWTDYLKLGSDVLSGGAGAAQNLFGGANPVLG